VNQFSDKMLLGLVLFNSELMNWPIDPMKLTVGPLIARLNMLLQ
jgi:hypothetical protein